MFEYSLLRPSARRAPITLGYVIEGILLGALVLVPLIRVQALPDALVRPVPLAPPPPSAAPATPPAVKTVHRTTLRELLTVPVTVSNRILQTTQRQEAAIEAPAAGYLGSVPGGDGSGLWNSTGVGAGSTPPAAPLRNPGTVRLKVGGQVEAARLIFQAMPRYPDIARIARVQGTVRLEAIVSTTGAIQSLRLVSGPPLLVNAALDAVSRWRYQPTLLNGEPVEVSTEIDVNFTLSE